MTGEGALAVGYAERLANRVAAEPGDHFLLAVLLHHPCFKCVAASNNQAAKRPLHDLYLKFAKTR